MLVTNPLKRERAECRLSLAPLKFGGLNGETVLRAAIGV